MSAEKSPPTWTTEKKDKAQAELKYMKIDKVGNLLLTGALKMWTTVPDFVYLPELRIAGLSETTSAIGVKNYPLFEYVTGVIKYTPEQFQGLIQFSNDNVLGVGAKSPFSLERLGGVFASQFRAELDQIAGVNKVKPEKKPGYQLKEIDDIAAEIRKLTVSKGAEGNVTVVKKERAKGAKRAAQPLSKKFFSLAVDRGLDVTSLLEGKGTKTIQPPKSTSKIGVKVTMVNAESKEACERTLYSSNPESLLKALEELYPGDKRSQEAYVKTWHFNKETATKKPVANIRIEPINPIAVPLNIVANGISSPVAQTMQNRFG